jgi:hypothetical protein
VLGSFAPLGRRQDLYASLQLERRIGRCANGDVPRRAGWEPAVVSMLLDEMHVEVPPEWLIREVSVAELEAFIRKLRLGLAERALPSA